MKNEYNYLGIRVHWLDGTGVDHEGVGHESIYHAGIEHEGIEHEGIECLRSFSHFAVEFTEDSPYNYGRIYFLRKDNRFIAKFLAIFRPFP